MSTTITDDEREQRTLEAARADRARENRLRRRDLALAIGTPIVLLLLWELCARVEIIDPRFFPAPTVILAAGVTMIGDGELGKHAGPTLIRLLVGGGLGDRDGGGDARLVRRGEHGVGLANHAPLLGFACGAPRP